MHECAHGAVACVQFVHFDYGYNMKVRGSPSLPLLLHASRHTQESWKSVTCLLLSWSVVALALSGFDRDGRDVLPDVDRVGPHFAPPLLVEDRPQGRW